MDAEALGFRMSYLEMIRKMVDKAKEMRLLQQVFEYSMTSPTTAPAAYSAPSPSASPLKINCLALWHTSTPPA